MLESHPQRKSLRFIAPHQGQAGDVNGDKVNSRFWVIRSKRPLPVIAQVILIVGRAGGVTRVPDGPNVDTLRVVRVHCPGEVGVDELVRTFDYKEKPEVMKIYPQYYHKTDKVSRPMLGQRLLRLTFTRTADQCTLSSTAE